jgi:hypothetical protein
MLDVVYPMKICHKKWMERKIRQPYDSIDKLRLKESTYELMLQKELFQVELQINTVTDKFVRVKEELENLYITLRCDSRKYSTQDNEDCDLISMSQTADEYIQLVYHLENRRRELILQLESAN